MSLEAEILIQRLCQYLRSRKGPCGLIQCMMQLHAPDGGRPQPARLGPARLDLTGKAFTYVVNV